MTRFQLGQQLIASIYISLYNIPIKNNGRLRTKSCLALTERNKCKLSVKAINKQLQSQFSSMFSNADMHLHVPKICDDINGVHNSYGPTITLICTWSKAGVDGFPFVPELQKRERKLDYWSGVTDTCLDEVNKSRRNIGGMNKWR